MLGRHRSGPEWAATASSRGLTLLFSASQALLLAETAFMQLVYFFLLFRCCFFTGHISLLAEL